MELKDLLKKAIKDEDNKKRGFKVVITENETGKELVNDDASVVIFSAQLLNEDAQRSGVLSDGTGRDVCRAVIAAESCIAKCKRFILPSC